MTESAQSARNVSEADQKKAKAFFDRAKTVADTGQYDYAIKLFIEGLEHDPDAVEAHQSLREVSLVRKAGGGKGLGMFEAMKLRRPTRDDKVNMLNAERLLAYDPGNMDHMVSILQCAHRAGYYGTAMWMGQILLKANEDSKQDPAKYIILKDVYKDMGKWREAVDACQRAYKQQPQSMDLQHELRNLSAQLTMKEARYDQGFENSIRDREGQQQLMEKDKDVVSVDVLARTIIDAEADYKADPRDAARLNRLVDALVRTEDPEHENRAIELLEEAYARTKQFPYHRRMGQIKMKQMGRMERSLRSEMESNPKDVRLKEDYEQFRREQLEFELSQYNEALEQYPTDLGLKFEVASRLFELKRYEEAIPLLQQAVGEPKLKTEASIYLGRAFLEAGFAEEAVDTLQGVVDAYAVKGDDKSKDMHYWQGRALEAKGDMDLARKRYSQVAMWEFTFRDVQQRLKALRESAKQ